MEQLGERIVPALTTAQTFAGGLTPNGRLDIAGTGHDSVFFARSATCPVRSPCPPSDLSLWHYSTRKLPMMALLVVSKMVRVGKPSALNE
jgi:hypothetical protein